MLTYRVVAGALASVCGIALLAGAGSAWVQSYPTRTVRIEGAPTRSEALGDTEISISRVDMAFLRDRRRSS